MIHRENEYSIHFRVTVSCLFFERLQNELLGAVFASKTGQIN